MPGADARYLRWTEHLERIIQEVYRTHHYRYLWRELAEITQAADLPASVIFAAFAMWYGTTQTAAVRRQLDRRRDVVSLIRLLDEIARHPGVMTRERHVAVWMRGDGDSFEPEAHRNFDRFSGGRDHDRIDVAQVRADIERLEEAGRVVERFVDETIAHHADRPTHEVPTYAVLNSAIDTIGEVVSKYASMLKAEMLWELEPVIQEDWKAPFRQAWIPRGN